MTSTTPQKKRRLSNLFGAKKDKNKDQSPNGANHDLHPSTSTQTQLDSAYASSAPTSSKRNSNAEIVPVENNGNIEGVSPDRNLALNKSTGQVVDDDTGQVVVTTTTTTTTTMTTKPGQKNAQVEVTTQKDGQPVIAEAPGDMPPMSNSTSRSPIAPSGPSPPNVGNSPVGPPGPQHNNSTGPPQSYAPPRADPETFPVPARNPMRDREPMDPVSPIRPNFSYPSRSDIREEPMPQQQPAPKSTFGNLKAAAQGLHGVGETVRGTLNNEIDTRFPRSNSQKAAVANAKNQAVLDNGNREMSHMNMRRSQQYDAPQAPPMQSPSGRDSMPSQLVPGSASRQSLPPQQQALPQQQQPQQFLPPPREEAELPYGGSNSTVGNGSSSEMSQVPSSFSPESSAPEKKQGGLRKLMKRRPVGPT